MTANNDNVAYNSDGDYAPYGFPHLKADIIKQAWLGKQEYAERLERDLEICIREEEKIAAEKAKAKMSGSLPRQ